MICELLDEAKPAAANGDLGTHVHAPIVPTPTSSGIGPGRVLLARHGPLGVLPRAARCLFSRRRPPAHPARHPRLDIVMSNASAAFLFMKFRRVDATQWTSQCPIRRVDATQLTL